MGMYKLISVIGHFGKGRNFLDGQTVKTKIVTKGLVECYGERAVLTMDTAGNRIVSLLKAPFYVIYAVCCSKNIIIFPAHNAVRVYVPLLALMKCLFSKRKLHYCVIGGWLPSFVENRALLSCCLEKFDGIYVETNTMYSALKKKGYSNLVLMPNCKNLNILFKTELVFSNTEPLRLCTFSRVSKMKGISDAFDAVQYVNCKLGRVVFSLDIFGPIDEGQGEWFREIQETFPGYVKYCGCVDFDKSVEVLKSYYALLFPTRYFTEGVPGTIIDAYASGVPVIASKWQSFSDIIDENITGVGYEFGNVQALKDTLLGIAQDINKINRMKVACLAKAHMYAPRIAISLLRI